ncbi:hypothetical protein CW304_13295 [Bacillus sp. UFRGS-B20]|nr:hypothetical protein CW304_13295 [Bacillus sp. UFRGS-B20]
MVSPTRPPGVLLSHTELARRIQIYEVNEGLTSTHKHEPISAALANASSTNKLTFTNCSLALSVYARRAIPSRYSRRVALTMSSYMSPHLMDIKERNYGGRT